MNTHFKDTVKNLIPKPVFKLLKSAKDRITDLQLGPPVVQMYVNSEGVDTHIAINDFYSFLIPEVKCSPRFRCEFHDPEGKKILVHEGVFNSFGSVHFKVNELFQSQGVQSPYGLMTVQVIPSAPRKIEYKRMGQVGAFYYVLYEHVGGEAKGSLGQVHPSSVLDPGNTPSGAFVSNQSIVSKGLTGIRLMQCNPSYHPHRMEHRILNSTTGEILLSKTTELPALGMKMVDFDLKDILASNPGVPLTMGVDRLPSSNSKPLLVRKSESGIWSYSHS